MLRISPKVWIMLIHAFLALTMLIDFSLPGNAFTEKVKEVNSSLEKHYNASGNSHYSFSIQTEHYNFSVPESAASTIQAGQTLQIKVSPLFKEVNSFEVVASGTKKMHSLRIFSGLIIPLVGLLLIGFGYKYGRKSSTLVFVIEVLLLANFIYLLN